MKDDTHLTETLGPAVKKAETMLGDPEDTEARKGTFTCGLFGLFTQGF